MSLLGLHGWCGLELTLVVDEEVGMSSYDQRGKGSAWMMVSPHGM